MESTINKLIEFWDKTLGGGEPEAIAERWISEESFINPINKYIADDGTILDYGCGSGWLSYELTLMKPALKVLGVDPSPNAIKLDAKCAELSNFNNMKFVCGMQDVLLEYQNQFDTAISVNTLDVLPIEIIEDILQKVKSSLKKNGYFLVCINPDYPFELLEKMGYSKKDGYLYKNDILRGIEKTKEEWIELLSKYFSFVEFNEFCLLEQEHQYPRRMFVLKNNK